MKCGGGAIENARGLSKGVRKWKQRERSTSPPPRQLTLVVVMAVVVNCGARRPAVYLGASVWPPSRAARSSGWK